VVNQLDKADDNVQQVFILNSYESDSLQNHVSDCLNAVGSWMAANRLLLNNDKTETLWCSSLRRQHQIPTRPVHVGSASVQPVATVRNLGVYLDTDATMRAHVTSTVQACFAILRQINSVRHSLTRPALITLLRALVISKLDYCNSVLAGAPAVLLIRFQSVLNAAARLVFSAPLLQELHCLRVPERIQFRLCVLTYRCLNGTAPQYLSECILPASSRSSGRQIRSTESVSLLVPSTCCTTIGDRTFPVAAARAWNSLPQRVRPASSIVSFRRELKTYLFLKFFPVV